MRARFNATNLTVLSCIAALACSGSLMLDTFPFWFNIVTP